MTIELARPHAVAEPWGCRNLAPWCAVETDGVAIGEVRFERTDPAAPPTALLVKLLFTSEPLSIQVHPDDDIAHAMGLPNGRTEAWYVLAAEPTADVALGPARTLTREHLAAAIADGSVVDLAARRPVGPDDVVFVPARTIHAIGSGLVIAEIQQRCDTTFRLYDYGHGRELNVEAALAAAALDPAPPSPIPSALAEGRTRLVSHLDFALERIDLPGLSHWDMVIDSESWLLVIDGTLQVGSIRAGRGDVVFLEDEVAELVVGPDGVKALLAYTGAEPIPRLSRQRAGLIGAPSAPETERPL